MESTSIRIDMQDQIDLCEFWYLELTQTSRCIPRFDIDPLDSFLQYQIIIRLQNSEITNPLTIMDASACYEILKSFQRRRDVRSKQECTSLAVE